MPIVRQQHQGIIYDIAASPTGALMATVGEDRFVRIWRGSVASPPLVGHLGKVLAVAISAKGLIASGGERNTIFLWDLHKGARARLPVQDKAIAGLAFGNKSDLLASITRDRYVKVWRHLENELHCNLKGHTDEVLSVAFAPRDEFLASGDRAGQVIFWRLP